MFLLCLVRLLDYKDGVFVRALLILFGLFVFVAYFYGTKYDYILFIAFIGFFILVEVIFSNGDDPPDDD
ncbi:hypothetical protein COA18_05160 [Priestia megaterium]|nr:hypothetical protein COA18_05160 [Priestia megaterium]